MPTRSRTRRPADADAARSRPTPRGEAERPGRLPTGLGLGDMPAHAPPGPGRIGPVASGTAGSPTPLDRSRGPAVRGVAVQRRTPSAVIQRTLTFGARQISPAALRRELTRTYRYADSEALQQLIAQWDGADRAFASEEALTAALADAGIPAPVWAMDRDTAVALGFARTPALEAALARMQRDGAHFATAAAFKRALGHARVPAANVQTWGTMFGETFTPYPVTRGADPNAPPAEWAQPAHAAPRTNTPYVFNHVTTDHAGLENQEIDSVRGNGEFGAGFYTLTGGDPQGVATLAADFNEGNRKKMRHAVRMEVPQDLMEHALGMDALNGDERALVDHVLQNGAGYPANMTANPAILAQPAHAQHAQHQARHDLLMQTIASVNRQQRIMILPDDKAQAVVTDVDGQGQDIREDWDAFYASKRGEHALVIGPQRPAAIAGHRQYVWRGAMGQYLMNSATRSHASNFDQPLGALR